MAVSDLNVVIFAGQPAGLTDRLRSDQVTKIATDSISVSDATKNALNTAFSDAVKLTANICSVTQENTV